MVVVRRVVIMMMVMVMMRRMLSCERQDNCARFSFALLFGQHLLDAFR